MTPTICPKGTMCGSQSTVVVPCPLGTYQDQPGSSTCKPCLAGHYCDVSADTGTIYPALCSAGTACPNSTVVPTPCAAGYYQSSAGSSSCLVCPSGYYCGDPLGTVTPIACGPGTKCVEKSVVPASCNPGTYQDSSRSSECQVCREGYYCPEGSSTAMIDCPAGSSCVAGSVTVSPCAVGHYQSEPRSSSCLVCPDGYYCDKIGTVTPLPCPPGSKCASGVHQVLPVCI